MRANTDLSDYVICLHVHLRIYSNTDENKYNWKLLTCKSLKHGRYFPGEVGKRPGEEEGGMGGRKSTSCYKVKKL